MIIKTTKDLENFNLEKIKDEEVYIQLPKGFTEVEQFNEVLQKLPAVIQAIILYNELPKSIEELAEWVEKYVNSISE
jgi:hypothetical protein